MRPSLKALAFCVVFTAFAHAEVPAGIPVLPEGKTVVVDGAKLWYVEEGQGEPLVIITGGPGAAHYLYPYFNDLKEHHRLIYLDSYGTGNSERAPKRSDYTFARHVDEIEGLRKALGLGTINLLGHSYGSLVVQAYALKYPASLKRLIVVSPLTSAEAWQRGNDYVAERIRQHYPEVAAKIKELRAKGLNESDKELEAVFFTLPEDLFYYANVKEAGHLALDFNTDVTYGLVGDNPDFQVGGDLAGLDFRPRLKDIRSPFLVLAGRFDYVVPPACTYDFKTCAPQAQFVMFEKSGHNLFREEHDKMIAVLREFLGTPAETK